MFEEGQSRFSLDKMEIFRLFMCDSVEGVWPRVACLLSVRTSVVLCQKLREKVSKWGRNVVRAPYIFSAQWYALPKPDITLWRKNCLLTLASLNPWDGLFILFVCIVVLIVSSRWRQEQAFFRWVKTFFWTNCGWRGRRTTPAAQLSCVISCISSNLTLIDFVME